MAKKRDITRERYEAILDRIDVWERRERRAVNTLRKLRDAKTRYESRRPDLIRSVLLTQLRQSSKVAKPGTNGTMTA
jgi:hypothetical protein